MNFLKQQITEITRGGWRVIHRKSRALLEYTGIIVCGLWAVPVVIFTRCITPWKIIRFGPISTSRIGDFAFEVGHKWAMAHRQSKKYLDLYWFKHKPVCNEFWATIVRRNLHVSPWIRPLDFWNQVIPGGSNHHLPVHYPAFYDAHGWLEQNSSRLQFLPEEDAAAKKWLQRQGWNEGDPFVCLIVRDSSFLDVTCPNTDPSRREGIPYDPIKGYGWDHLNYRDSDIAAYVPAAEWLADQGVWVLRMGKIMARPMPSGHARIIDYAFHPEKSDFLDIWLFAHCDFCISTGTGIDAISDVYRRPLLFLNLTPLRSLISWSNAIHVPKNLFWLDSGIPLNLRDQFCNHAEYYESIGIRMVDLSSEEILAAVQERWQRLQGTWIDPDQDVQRNNRFWEILKSIPLFNKNHGWIHPENRAGAIWLQSKGEEYLK